MDYISQINDFVDGTLDPSREGELFMALASSDELRNELKQFIELESTAKNDAEAFAPSAAVTMGLFNQLGISAAVGTGAAAASMAVAQNSNGLLGWLSRFSSQIFTGVISASVAFLAAVGVFSGNDDSSDAESVVSAQPAYTASIPVVVHDTIVKEVEVPVIRNHYIREAAVNGGNQTENLANTTDNKQMVPVVFRASIPMNKPLEELKMEYAGTIRQPEQIMHEVFNSDEQLFTKSAWSIEYAKSQYWHANGTNLLEPDIAESSTPIFENSGLSLLCALTEDFSLGVNLRNEFIYQDYTGIEDHMHYRYQQNTNYHSLSMLARYRVLDFSVLDDNLQISLNAQLDLGTFGSLAPSRFAAGGWTGRGAVIVELAPSDIISIISSLEYGSYFYDNQGVAFSSQKLGFNTGIRVNIMRLIR